MQMWKQCYAWCRDRISSDAWRVYKIQFVLLFALSTLLFIGFPGTREWRRLAEESQMHTIIRSWDGLAWYTWLAVAPLMMLLVRRFPLARGRIMANLLRLAAGSGAIYLVVTHVRYVLRVLPEALSGAGWQQMTDFNSYAYNTFAMLPLDLLTYSGFFAVSFAIDSYHQHRQNAEQALRLQLKAAKLQSDLARAELAALRGQLHPHFLFNSFNALATLVRQQKNEAAVEIIAQLSALLRLAIDRTGLQEIPLHQEIDFIRRYLEIEHVRFGDKLHVNIAVEAEAMNVLVPNIVLQPLVENAIKHGISLRTTPGTVRVRAGRAGARLQIEIADDGADNPDHGFTDRWTKKTGIGLTNTRAQLDKLYGTDYTLVFSPQPTGGTVVTLNLPWRLAPAA